MVVIPTRAPSHGVGRTSVSLVVACLVASPCLALDPAQPASSYLRTNFTMEDGLDSAIISDVLQTPDGFLWVCTRNNVVRFDGRHFTPIPDQWRTPSPWIPRTLAVAPDGALWIGTALGLVRVPSKTVGLFSPVPPEFYHVGSGPSDAIETLTFTPDGVLWVGTMAGLFRFERGAFSAVIPGLAIHSVAMASGGHLLITTRDGFVEWAGTRVVEHPDLPARFGLPADKIYHVFEDHAGARWFCTGAGLARQIGGSIQRFPPFEYRRSAEAYRTLEDSQGNIWVRMASGFFRATANGLEPVSKNLHVVCMFVDRDGNLWVGTNGQGLVRFKDRLVRMFTTADGLPNNIVMTVLAASDGKLWVGNNCGGLSWFDGRRFRTYSEKDGLANSCVFALTEDFNKDLWVATFGGGVFRFRDGRFTRFSKLEGLKSDVARGLFFARDHSLWIPTDEGLSRLQDGHVSNYGMAEGLASRHPINLFQDRDGALWVGTTRGLNRFNGAGFVPVPAATGIVRILGEGATGSFYATIGTKGIFRISTDPAVKENKGGEQAFIVTADLQLMTMLRAGQDTWFTSDVIYRAPAGSLERWEHEPDAHRDYTRFDSTDGLASAQCSDAYPNAAMTSDGKLWVATTDGLAMLDTLKLPRSDRKPALYIEQVTVGRAVQSPGDKLVVPAGARHVELRFDAIELRSPEKIHFQYRMDGVDQEWLEGNSTGTAVYTGFPIGTHQFHVRACNRDGVWDRAGMVYDITQLPFFYETNLFRLAVVATALVLIAGVYQLRLRQMAVQMNAELNARVEERTRMARELHDTLLQTIQVSKMVAEHTLAGYGDDKRDPRTNALRKLSGWLTQALQEARASLQSLRLSASETNNLAEGLRAAAAEYVLDHPIQFSLSVKGTVKEMHPIVRDDVYHIGYEAIRNACNHSGGSLIEIQLEYAHDLVLRVRDDGKGIDSVTAAQGKPGHFGLKGMQERSSRIGGKLNISSSPGPGTQIELIVPGRVIFLDPRPFWRTLFEKRPQ